MNIFRSAVTGDDGEIDAGYLGLFAVMVLMLGSIPVTLLLVTIRLFVADDHPLDLSGVAAVIGAAAVGFGASAGGVGAFRAGDKPHSGTTSSTVTKVVATGDAGSTPAAPLNVAVVDMPPTQAAEAATDVVAPPKAKDAKAKKTKRAQT